MGKNRERAMMLMEDLKAWKPKQAKETTVEKLERFLDTMDKKQKEYEQVEISRIPKDTPPEQYQQELAWARMTARELVIEEINSLFR